MTRIFAGRSKYGNRSCYSMNGRKCRSTLEASICTMLELREKANEMKILKYEQHIHYRFHGIKVGEYWPDFTVRMADGEIRFFEAKGAEKEVWPWKLNIWRIGGPATLEIWKGDWKRYRQHEVVMPVMPGLFTDHAHVFGKLGEA